MSASSGTAADQPRLYRVTGASGGALPTGVALEAAPVGGYPTRAIGAMTLDGGSIVFCQDGGVTDTSTQFFSVPIGGGSASAIGSNDYLDDVSGIALDATYAYLAGRHGTLAAGTTGIYRLARADLATASAVPTLILQVGIDGNNGALLRDVVNDTLYFRASSRAVWAVIAPSAATPRWAGPIWQPSGTSTTPDSGLTFDPAGPSLYVVDHSHGSSHFLRID